MLEAKVNNTENPFNDVVDSRGFVDGVKVARKMSKANVLGKAAEYIKYASSGLKDVAWSDLRQGSQEA